MEASSTYIVIAIVAFLLIVLALIFVKRNKQKPSNLLNVAFLIIVFSMFFDERIIAYPLLGLAVILAVIDAIIKIKKKG